MNNVSAIIVDDEQLARQIIRKYLEDFPGIEVVAECTNGFDAVKNIQALSPQLVFLDIKMPKLDGFEVLEVLDHLPAVIFSTAHDEFAIKAFELNAIDYLLKPYSRERFASAVSKALERIHSETTPAKDLEPVKEQLYANSLERVVIKNGSNIKIIPVSSINYIEAQDDYVMIYTTEGRHLKQQTMRYYENCLDSAKFIRVHRSYIVNIQQIKQIEPYEKDSFVMKLICGATVSVSKAGFKRLKDELNF